MNPIAAFLDAQSETEPLLGNEPTSGLKPE